MTRDLFINKKSKWSVDSHLKTEVKRLWQQERQMSNKQFPPFSFESTMNMSKGYVYLANTFLTLSFKSDKRSATVLLVSRATKQWSFQRRMF